MEDVSPECGSGEKMKLSLLDEQGVFLNVEVGYEVSKTIDDYDDGVHADDVCTDERIESLRDEFWG